MQLESTRGVVLYDVKTKLLLTTIILTAAVQIGPIAYSGGRKAHGEGSRRHRTESSANLPPQDRQKLHAAHEKAMQDPAIRASHDKLQQARREFRNSMRAAMLKADPTIQPILDKLPKGEKGAD